MKGRIISKARQETDGKDKTDRKGSQHGNFGVKIRPSLGSGNNTAQELLGQKTKMLFFPQDGSLLQPS